MIVYVFWITNPYLLKEQLCKRRDYFRSIIYSTVVFSFVFLLSTHYLSPFCPHWEGGGQKMLKNCTRACTWKRTGEWVRASKFRRVHFNEFYFFLFTIIFVILNFRNVMVFLIVLALRWNAEWYFVHPNCILYSY